MAQTSRPRQAKDHQARYPFIIPAAADPCTTAGCALMVIYLSYNAGYLEPSASGRELSDDAIWLVELVPSYAELGGGVGTACTADVPSSRTQARFQIRIGCLLLQDQVGPAGDDVAISRADGIWRLPLRSVARQASAASGHCRLPYQRHIVGRDGLVADPDAL
jgi:predicted RNA polymerase sigma factor